MISASELCDSELSTNFTLEAFRFLDTIAGGIDARGE